MRQAITLTNAHTLTQCVHRRVGWITQVVWSPRTPALAVSSAAGVTLYSGDDLRPQGQLTGHSGPVKGIAVHPNGKLIASASADTTIRLWQLEQGGQFTVLNGHTGAVNSAAFSPDGQHLLSCSADQTVRLWSADGRALRQFDGHSDEVNRVVFVSDHVAVSAGRDKALRWWEITSGVTGVLGEHDDWVRHVAASADGRYVASASKDSTLALWDTNTQTLVLRWQAHQGGVDAAAFTPDGALLATGGRDHLVKVWETSTGHEVARLETHTKPVMSVAFSPDGHYLATGGGDNSLFLWKVYE